MSLLKTAVPIYNQTYSPQRSRSYCSVLVEDIHTRNMPFQFQEVTLLEITSCGNLIQELKFLGLKAITPAENPVKLFLSQFL